MSYYQQQPPVAAPPPQGYVPEGYLTKDAYPPPPPGYSQGYPQPGYPPAGYPLPQPQPQVVYTQAPAPPQKEVGCLEGCFFIVLVSAVWPESSAVAVWNIAVSN
ncbi:protein CYSTEINE-RICH TRANSMEMBRANE MODULE 13-like isoform X1 [Alnus glutinosa]|uniref:protein CYSTEINE-RICH TRANSMEMBRANE MODULE 13-like isoform X1 n=1 Tax=Alnus glutinosa TaxID=3517 RepID=UPI002D796723|nr:protein CYSTEINE-RICH TRANSMEMBRANE MODULE 13-like isoform X1 [Alnus glutinosa]